MPRRDNHTKFLKLPSFVAEQAVRVAKELKIPLARLIAEATAAYGRLHGVNEVTDEPGPTKNGADLRW